MNVLNDQQNIKNGKTKISRKVDNLFKIPKTLGVKWAILTSEITILECCSR